MLKTAQLVGVGSGHHSKGGAHDDAACHDEAERIYNIIASQAGLSADEAAQNLQSDPIIEASGYDQRRRS